MEPLTWTGALGPIVLPLMQLGAAVLVLAVIAQMLLSLAGSPLPQGEVLAGRRSPADWAGRVVLAALLLLLACCAALVVAGLVLPDLTSKGILGALAHRLWPVWAALIAQFTLSIIYKRRLGLYGKLFDSTIGMIGLAIVMFWVFAAIFGALDLIVTHDPLQQVSGMKNKVPALRCPRTAPIPITCWAATTWPATFSAE